MSSTHLARHSTLSRRPDKKARGCAATDRMKVGGFRGWVAQPARRVLASAADFMSAVGSGGRYRGSLGLVLLMVAGLVCVPAIVRAEPDVNPSPTASSSSPTTGYRRPYGSDALGDSKPLGRGLSLGIVGGIYVGLNILAYLAWWIHAPPDHFELSHDGWFGDRTYAGGSDKLGHFFMNHFLTRANAGVLEEGGWHPRTSTYAGAALTLGTYYLFEMRDGYSTGFSMNDMISNFAGAAFAILFREAPVLDRLFDTRVEYFPSSAFLSRPTKHAFNFNEDYTGLKFLLAWHLSTLPVVEQSGGPLRFVDLVVGYHTRNYRPKETDRHLTKYQDRYIGISLNMQRIVDELWMGRHPQFGKSKSRVHRLTRFAAEFFNLPFTSVPVATFTNEYHR
jgi:hypothetical protein